MKFQKQTKFGDEGNCLEACIASLFDLSINNVPSFEGEDEFEWHKLLNMWLSENYKLSHIPVLINTELESLESFFKYRNCYHLMSGYVNSNSPIRHCVIGRKGKMVFNPDMADCKFIGDITYHFFVKNEFHEDFKTHS